MVSDRQILASNALINDASIPQISVFAGATSGIGKLTIEALINTQTTLRIYLIGRASASERTRTFINDMQTINPKAEIIWIEAEIALLAEAKRVGELIISKESRIDLLFLSAGYAPLSGRHETTEKIEIAQSLEYYSRIALIHHFLPALNSAESPRVVSVLGGGLESLSAINLDDIDLRSPGNWSGIKAQGQYLTLNTVTLDLLADENPDITFIHAWPGWVDTGNVRRSFEPNSILGWVSWLFLEPLIRLVSIRDRVAAQRYLFLCTSAVFGGRGVRWEDGPGVNAHGTTGNGLFLVNYRCECTPNQKVMPALREKARDLVWRHTREVLQRYW